MLDEEEETVVEDDEEEDEGKEEEEEEKFRVDTKVVIGSGKTPGFPRFPRFPVVLSRPAPRPSSPRSSQMCLENLKGCSLSFMKKKTEIDPNQKTMIFIHCICSRLCISAFAILCVRNKRNA